MSYFLRNCATYVTYFYFLCLVTTMLLRKCCLNVVELFLISPKKHSIFSFISLSHQNLSSEASTWEAKSVIQISRDLFPCSRVSVNYIRANTGVLKGTEQYCNFILPCFLFIEKQQRNFKRKKFWVMYGVNEEGLFRGVWLDRRK